jgi:DNA invertase Pin-like site-specific DNA recombinase
MLLTGAFFARASIGMKSFVVYCRVSTKAQGLDGLGIEAQLTAVRRYIANQAGITAAEFTECESGKKTDKDRPQLKAALDLCKRTKSTLVVAKLDRLSRNAEFLLSLQNANVEFVCTDAPNVDRFTVGILALVAQREREQIGLRTKAALAALKARGVKLGNPNGIESVKAMNEGARQAAKDFRKEILPIIEDIQKTGVKTSKGIAECLNRRGISTRHGKAWGTSSVRNVLVN